jgi:AraC-like DNA-binding protein
MSRDTLSDLLRNVRLRGAAFYDVQCAGDWAVGAPPAREVATAVMPGADHVIEYHVVTRGACWGAIAGEPPVQLADGDVVMFPQGDEHVLSSKPGMRATPDVAWMVATSGGPKPIPVRYSLGETGTGDNGCATRLVCGFIGCDLRPFNPLIATLPRMLHLPAAGRGWIGEVLQQAIAESAQRLAGGEAMLERISEIVFVDAVRRHLDRLPPGSTGWLAGLRDRFVGRALALLHASPARDWTIEALAGEAGLSRSALHERFVQVVGVPPMQYLAQWRMQLGASLLRSTRANVATIALEVGYDSEAAFSRAFKRLVGMPPAAWRRAGASATPQESRPDLE